MFHEKGILKNFAKLKGKHLCQSLFFNNVAGIKPATLLKNRLWHGFPCEFCKTFKNTFFIEHLLDDCFWEYYQTKSIKSKKQPLGNVPKRCSVLLAGVGIFIDFIVLEEQLKIPGLCGFWHRYIITFKEGHLGMFYKNKLFSCNKQK